MQWVDQAIILHRTSFNEHDAIVSVLSSEHGIYKALVKNGYSNYQKKRIIQPGYIIQCRWYARIEEHLGQLTIELDHNDTSYFYNSEAELLAINALLSIILTLLPERMPQPQIYIRCLYFMHHIHKDNFLQQYALLELFILEHYGIGLDLQKCALNGTDKLGYISPKTGRACSISKGEPYKNSLFRLPACLLSDNPFEEKAPLEDHMDLFTISSHFLYKHVFEQHHIKPPLARDQLQHYVRMLSY